MRIEADSENSRIWIVDDDEVIRGLLTYVLDREGFGVTSFDSGVSFLAAIDTGPPDLVILDLRLDGLDGLDLLKALRIERGLIHLPIIMMTASEETLDRYKGFDAGADDYLIKPFDNVELLVRIRNRLRRSAQAAAPIAAPASLATLKAGDLVLDSEKRELSIGDRKVDLTGSESAILAFLLKHAGRPSTPEAILVEALGYPPRLGNPDIVRSHIRNLREKLEEDPRSPKRLINRPGVGYSIALSLD